MLPSLRTFAAAAATLSLALAAPAMAQDAMPKEDMASLKGAYAKLNPVG